MRIARETVGTDSSFAKLLYPPALQDWDRSTEALAEEMRRLNPGHTFSVCNDAIGWHDPETKWVSLIINNSFVDGKPWLPWVYAKGILQFEADTWVKMQATEPRPPLAEKTKQRIAAALQRFGMVSPQ